MGYIPFDVSFDSIADICTWCDEGFSYFDLTEAFDELLETNHIIDVSEISNNTGDKTYFITEKGKDTAKLFEDHLPLTVRKEAQIYALKVVRKIRRSAGLQTYVSENGANDFIVHLVMSDVFSINMNVVNKRQASMLEKNFKQNAEKIYNELLTALTKSYDEEKKK